jgi:signal transduction histidine kinase/CheY-like chemotaxis protein/sensor domain CHASE-containing protein
MRLQNKIFLLYLSIVVIFFSGIIAFYVLQKKEQNLYLQEKIISDKSMVKNFMEYNSKSFLNPIKNNSEWNEMVDFAESPNSTWGLNNIGILIPTFNFTYVWLYDKNLKRVFYIDTDSLEANNIYLTNDEVSSMFKNKTLSHSFFKKGKLLVELFGATVVPVNDISHKTKAKGFILGGKLWDENYIRELSKLSGFTISIDFGKYNQETAEDSAEQKGFVLYELNDIYGSHLANLRFHKSEHFSKDLSNTVKISLILLLLSIVTLLSFLFLIKTWINDPIRDIIRSLDNDDASYLKTLKLKRSEFGRISKLIDRFYYQKNLLLQEIEVRKKTEAELNNAKEIAESANNAKSGFMANMSHEIRNPLNAIIGLSNSLARSEMNEQYKEIIESLRISSHNLLNIVNDILDFSKIEANKVELFKSNFEVEQLIKEVYSSYQASAKFKKLDLSYKIDSDVPASLYGDGIKLRQVLLNLVSNAIKFTLEGRVAISVRSEKTENEKVSLIIEVSDTGIGIKKEDYDRLFQSFTQLDSSTTKEYSGTGLGLVIVKRYTNLMNGTINFSSEFGKGSSFIITIPFDMPVKPDIVAEPTYPSKDLSKLNQKILLAEDDRINQLYLKGFLRGKGFQVDTASNGIEALEKFNLNQYDIILMDGQMPTMDGFEASRRIREMEKLSNTHTPIIAITGYAVTGDKEKFLDTGMDDYISKPIDEERLVHLIQKYTKNSL